MQDIHYLAGDHPAFLQLARALRMYRNPEYTSGLPNGVRNTLLRMQSEFNRAFPDVASVYVWRYAASPNDKTATQVFHEEWGTCLRLQLGRGSVPLHIPCQPHDTVGVVAFPYADGVDGDRVLLSTPIVFTMEKRGVQALYPVIRRAIREALAHPMPVTGGNDTDVASLRDELQRAVETATLLRSELLEARRDNTVLTETVNALSATVGRQDALLQRVRQHIMPLAAVFMED